MLGGGTLVGGLATLYNLILNRNKPKVDIASIQAETTVKLSTHVGTLHDRISLMEAQIDEHQREAVATVKFYREQIEWFEKLDIAYRQRFHAVNSELGRLGIAIRTMEATFLERTGETVPRVEIKTYEQIVEPFPLPAIRVD